VAGRLAQGLPGTLLLISHDRDFLDAVVDHVLHVEQRKLNLYKGGYTAFERTRAERLAQQQQAYEKQQAQRAHMEKYIARFKAQATKARQAQSRIKALERMEELSAAHVDSPFDFVFRESQKISSPLLDLSEARLGYGDKAILEKVKLQLTPGARIGLLGPNGAGKSTLIKNLAGELQPLAGRLVRGENLAVGYFAQHQLDSLDDKASPLLHLQRIAPTEREQTLRDFLGGFDFRGAARRAGGELLRWRKGPPGPGADRLGTAEPAAARRTDQPPRPGNAPGADHGPAGVQRCRGGGVPRSSFAQEHHRRLPAGGRRQGRDLRRRPRRLQPLAGRVPPAQRAGQHAPVNPDKTDKKAQRQAAAALRQQLAPHKKAADKLEAELNQVHAQLAEIEPPGRQRALRGRAQG
jgi:ATP-binding cassette subfamily F protein 3